nr:hypothetical protein CFP56_32277 [Quercus suber]
MHSDSSSASSSAHLSSQGEPMELDIYTAGQEQGQHICWTKASRWRWTQRRQIMTLDLPATFFMPFKSRLRHNLPSNHFVVTVTKKHIGSLEMQTAD